MIHGGVRAGTRNESSRMRLKPSVTTVALTLIATAGPVAAEPGNAHYERVREAVFSDPYDVLPGYRVDAALFGESGEVPDNALRRAASRTLDSRADLIEFPHGQKLFQPNGICFSGTWHIDAASPYTGLFAQGTRVPAIVRASVMLDGTRRADRRAFGLAVKLFPRTGERTVNILAMESMAGRRLDHVADAVLDNHPPLGGLPPLTRLGTLLRIRRDLRAADEAHGGDGDIRYRSVYAPAAVGTPATEVRAPHWVRFQIPAAVVRVTADDFRDELDTARYPPDGLYYTIELAERHPRGKGNAAWTAAGRLVLEASVTSATCDRRLHFGHPVREPG